MSLVHRFIDFPQSLTLFGLPYFSANCDPEGCMPLGYLNMAIGHFRFH